MIDLIIFFGHQLAKLKCGLLWGSLGTLITIVLTRDDGI